MNKPDWPKHPDGKPKKMGEMTLEEQKLQVKYACRKLKKELESPQFRKALENNGNQD